MGYLTYENLAGALFVIDMEDIQHLQSTITLYPTLSSNQRYSIIAVLKTGREIVLEEYLTKENRDERYYGLQDQLLEWASPK